VDPVPVRAGPTGQDWTVGFDALLVLSFGGPEGPDDVRPFLENVTRGRGVPARRLDEVAQHYLHFGGVSPINRLNRELIARVEDELSARGMALPVYFGNRNWHPLVEDTVAAMAADGVDRALVFATSAYGGYSACQQYHEDIARARASVGHTAPHLVKLPHFFDHPLFVKINADAVVAALGSVGEPARVVFTAHSVPVAADEVAGPPGGGGRLYSRQVHRAAELVAAAAGVTGYDVVWQSRSGPPSVPWLEPDVVDHLNTLADAGERAVVVSPLGFIADHLEVVWDLDTEARRRAQELGLTFARAATAGSDRRFAGLVVDLVQDAMTGAPSAVPLVDGAPAGGAVSGAPPIRGTVGGAPCVPGCCVARATAVARE
jgi:protoporphyrin/coproporphyrin ferrochelatase